MGCGKSHVQKCPRHNHEATTHQSVTILTLGGQLEAHIRFNATFRDLAEQVQREHQLDVIIGRYGNLEYCDHVLVRDVLQSGCIPAYGSSLSLLENQIGQLESPGCVETKDLRWATDVPASDTRVLNTVWILSIFAANMPVLSSCEVPPRLPDVNQVVFSAILSLEHLWGKCTCQGGQRPCKVWHRSKQLLMLHYDIAAHEKLLKFLLVGTQPRGQSALLKTAFTLVGRLLRFGICHFKELWMSGRFMNLLLVAQASTDARCWY